MTTQSAATLAVVLPLAAAFAGWAFGRHGPLARWIAVGAAGLTLLLALGAAVAVWAGGTVVATWAAVPTGWAPVEISVRADPLGVTLAVLVAAVALAVQVYSASALRHDPRYVSYAAVASLLTGAMLLVVLAEDLVLLFAALVALTVCSALPAVHRPGSPEARRAAGRAFVVPYLGDAAVLVGFFTLAGQAGSFQVSAVAAAAEPSTAATVAALLVLGGVAGKSAQLPLHVWLAGGTGGPAPTAALVNSATTVAAGAFVVARLYDAFLVSPVALATLAVVASVTMVLAALAAAAQDDLARVLAWSTASQLGLVLGGLAVGGYAAGLFHLVSHAAAKALLFLAAGAVAYTAGSTLLARLGGLAAMSRPAYRAATVGFAALAGVPPLACFFSTGSVLAAAERAAGGSGPVPVWAAGLVLAAGLLTIPLTAAYAARAWLLTFHGPPTVVAAGERTPPAMRVPLLVLSSGVVVLGALGPVTSAAFARGGGEVPGAGLHWVTSLLSLVLLLGGGSAAYSAWIREAQHDPAAVLGDRGRAVAADGFRIDVLYESAVARPVEALSRLVGAGDRSVLHPYALAAARAARALGAVPQAAQTGQVRSYVTALLAFVVVLGVTGAVVALA